MPCARDSEYVGGAQSSLVPCATGHEINLNMNELRRWPKTQIMGEFQRNVSLASVLLLKYAQEPSG